MNIRFRRLNRNLIPRAVLLARKILHQRLIDRKSSTETTRPIFVVGCQRSGTTLTLTVLGKCLDSWYYHPDDPRAFDRHRLRSDEHLRYLLGTSRARFVVFKPLTEMQRADRYLKTLPDLRVIWLYRQYDDVANSVMRKWDEGEHVRDLMQRFADRAWDRLKWRGENVSADQLERLDRCFHPKSTVQEAAALWWYLRSQFFFELGLDKNPRVRLFKYDDLVVGPVDEYRKMYEFCGMKFTRRVVRGVHPRSINRESAPTLAPEIRKLCDELMERFDRVYGKQQVESPPGQPADAADQQLIEN